jgi:hypothetical protein
MGRRRRDGNHTPQKNNSIEDSMGNEENGYPVPDPNKTMINLTKKPSDALKKNPSKEEILEEITEKHMDKILEMVNQNVQDALKKFQDTKNKDMRRHRNKRMNSDRTSINTKVKQRTL